jgi:hypothetical protein
MNLLTGITFILPCTRRQENFEIAIEMQLLYNPDGFNATAVNN